MVEGVSGKVMAVRVVAMVVEGMIGSRGDSVPSFWWPFLSHHCSLVVGTFSGGGSCRGRLGIPLGGGGMGWGFWLW